MKLSQNKYIVDVSIEHVHVAHSFNPFRRLLSKCDTHVNSKSEPHIMVCMWVQPAQMCPL